MPRLLPEQARSAPASFARRRGAPSGFVKETLEHELKLSAGAGFRLPELPGEPLPPRHFTSTYLDTADSRLARAGITLRRRVEGGRGLWQLKLPRGAARAEIEWPAVTASVPGEVRDLLAAHLRGGELVPIATLRTRRTGVRVKDLSGTVADVVLDAVAVLDGRRVARRFSEIEVERLGDEDEEALARIAEVLRQAGATDSDGRPKVFQALGLEPQPPPGPVPPSAPAADHLRAKVGVQLSAMLAHDPGTRLGTDAEELHQMRVATRRLRALLRAARPLLAPEWTEAAREELAWLGRALGAVRDLDVLLEHLRSEVAALDAPDRRAFLPALGRLDAARAEARAAMLDVLRSKRYFALLDRLQDAIGALPVVDAQFSLADIAAGEFKQLRRAVGDLGDEPSAEALHAVRIRVKRARYAAELAEAAVGKPATRFIERAKALQDILGEHQDAAVAEERIRELAAGVRGARMAFVAGRLAERQRARRQAARAAFAKAWAKLERRGRKAWS